EAADFFQVGAVAHLLERLPCRASKLDLALDDVQLGREYGVGGSQLTRNSLERPGKAQAAFQAYDEQVERVWQRAAEHRLTFGLLAVEPEAGADHSQDAETTSGEHGDLRGHDTHQAQGQPDEGGGDHQDQLNPEKHPQCLPAVEPRM